MSDYSIQSYQDLKVWQEAMNLAESCYKTTKSFPKEETYGMISQIKRGCKGIGVWGVREEKLVLNNHVGSNYCLINSPTPIHPYTPTPSTKCIRLW